MTVPSGVFVVGNPVLADRTPAHMFNTGLIQANGTVVNTVNGLAPAFRFNPPPLRTSSLYFGNLRDRWGPPRYGAHQEHQNQERLNLEMPTR
jgi:hypothetical protein